MDYKRIAIISNWRTGSTYFTMKKAHEHGVPFMGELFHVSRPFSIGEVPRGWITEESIREELRHLPAKEASDTMIIEALENGHPGCFNLRPGQIEDKYWPYLFENLDKVYYLYRRNWDAQVRSFVSVDLRGDWGVTGWFFQRPGDEHTPPDHTDEEMRNQKILGTWYNRTKPYISKVRPTFDLLEDRAALLIREYIRMYRCYKQHPGELVAYEDWYTGEQYRPDNKHVYYLGEEELMYPKFDTVGLFERDEYGVIKKEHTPHPDPWGPRNIEPSIDPWSKNKL